MSRMHVHFHDWILHENLSLIRMKGLKIRKSLRKKHKIMEIASKNMANRFCILNVGGSVSMIEGKKLFLQLNPLW